MSQRRPVIRIVTALATTIVLSFIALQYTSADIGSFIPTWRMIGHDVANKVVPFGRFRPNTVA